MSKHTPGPWKFFKNEPDGPPSVGHVDGYARVCTVNLRDGREPCGDWKANAHLIAAAPELLEACRLAARYIDPADDGPCPSPTEMLADLRAAIARAEGGEA